MINEIFYGVGHSAVASQPCPSGHITANKMLRYASPKLPSATSFIRKTLYDIIFKIKETAQKFFVRFFRRAGKNWRGSRGGKFLHASRWQNCEAILR